MFGLLPAIRMSRTDISGRLKDSGRAISGSRSRMQSVLVMGEMAMALVLLVGAGLMCRTLVQLWKVDPGFDPRNVTYFEVTPPPSLANQPPDAILAALRQINSTLHSVPGVEAVSLHEGALPMESDNERGFLLEGQELPTQRTKNIQQALEYAVEPEYLKTMRIPLLRGRFLSDEDNEKAARVAVIDASFAQQYFAGQDPIGKHIRIFEIDSDSSQRVLVPLAIVGVVGHVNQWGLCRRRPPSPASPDVPVNHAKRGRLHEGRCSGIRCICALQNAACPGSFFRVNSPETPGEQPGHDRIRQRIRGGSRGGLHCPPALLAHPAGRIRRAGCCCWPALEFMAYCRIWLGSARGKSACAWLLERSGLMYCAWFWETVRA